MRAAMHHVVRAGASLRWRLTLIFVAVLAVLLSALGAYAYFTLRASLVSNRVASLETDYNTARAVIGRLASGTAAARGRQLCSQAPTLVARSVGEVVHAATGSAVQVVIYDPNLSVAATVPAGAQPPQLGTSTLQTVLTTSARSSPQVLSAPQGSALVVAFPIRVVGAVCGIAQLSASMTPINNVLHDEVVLIGAGGGVTLLLALMLALFLTGRTLRPLRRLTDTAEQLAGGDLSARSRLVPTHDEVGVLAQGFDHMAERIEASFTAQQESEAYTRRFIADASHELRTPLTAIKGYIDVLRRGAAHDPEALRKALESMNTEAERMRVLLLDLLTLARLDARPELSLDTLDLNVVLRELLDDGIPNMPASLERQFASEALPVRADRNAVTGIVRNLLSNACAYAPGASQRWSTARDDGRARLDVHDDGPGIPPDDLPHVFERFYRGEKTRTREEGGSGLGLSIVQSLARAQGGDVAVNSAEGAGTTVSVWLPLA